MLFCIPLPRRTIATTWVRAPVKVLAEPFHRIVPGTLAKCRQLSWTEGVPSASPWVWPTSPLGLLDSEATAVLASKTKSGSKWEKRRACHQCCSWKAVTCAAQQAQPGRQNVPGTNDPTSYNDSCLSFGSLHSINYMPTYYCVKTPLWWVQYSLCIIAGILNWRKTYQGSLQATGEEDFTTSCASSDVPCWHSSRPASSARLGHHCEPLAGGDTILHSNVTATDAVGLGQLPTRCCAAARLQIVQLKEKKFKVSARTGPALPTKPSGFPSAQGEGGDSPGWRSTGSPAPSSLPFCSKRDETGGTILPCKLSEPSGLPSYTPRSSLSWLLLPFHRFCHLLSSPAVLTQTCCW